MDHRRGGALAYTVDGQSFVLRVQEMSPPDTATARADAPSPVALRTLVAPLTWEPVQRLLAWGAREGMTAAELLDTCRAATRPPATRPPATRTARTRAKGAEAR